MKTGIILARLQPIHNGHLELIMKSVVENDETYVFVGSADKFNQRNPLPIGLRMQLADEAIKTELNEQGISPSSVKVKIVPLEDLTDESDNSHDWGFYLYSKIVTITGNPIFTIYYSDGFEIITTWFPPFILKNNVSLYLLSRGAIASGISATKVREMILKEDKKELEKCVPPVVIDNMKTIKQHIELAKLIK